MGIAVVLPACREAMLDLAFTVHLPLSLLIRLSLCCAQYLLSVHAVPSPFPDITTRFDNRHL